MKNLHKTYLNEVIKLLELLRDEELPKIEEAAKLIADTIEQGGRIFAFGCTHSSLPVQDVVYRAGGMMLINPLFGPGIASLDVKPATLTSAMEKMNGYAKVILDHNPIKPGDVLIIVSVSGRNAVPVEMAMYAKERGIKVIGITSIKYAQSIVSRHVSGKKMHDFTDIVLDNKVPKGDAVLSDERVPQKFTPASGVTSSALLHALVSCVIEELLSRNFTPPVFLSANVDGGGDYNERLLKQFADRIFYM
jgi:uncharacterized phosphosugar-binding protein